METSFIIAITTMHLVLLQVFECEHTVFFVGGGGNFCGIRG